MANPGVPVLQVLSRPGCREWRNVKRHAQIYREDRAIFVRLQKEEWSSNLASRGLLGFFT